jgi:hypothetical protein
VKTLPDRQAAVLAKLRERGVALAPVMSNGRVVGAKAPNRSPAQQGVAGAPDADLSPTGPITRPKGLRPADRRTAPGAVFQFTIPAPCEFLNANRDGGHWASKAKKVRAWRRAGRIAATYAQLPVGLGRVQVDCYVVKPIQNRYDPANWSGTAKACLDGLVDYGMVEDDNRHFVAGPFMHEGGKGDDALIVRVTVLDMEGSK